MRFLGFKIGENKVFTQRVYLLTVLKVLFPKEKETPLGSSWQYPALLRINTQPVSQEKVSNLSPKPKPRFHGP